AEDFYRRFQFLEPLVLLLILATKSPDFLSQVILVRLTTAPTDTTSTIRTRRPPLLTRWADTPLADGTTVDVISISVRTEASLASAFVLGLRLGATWLGGGRRSGIGIACAAVDTADVLGQVLFAGKALAHAALAVLVRAEEGLLGPTVHLVHLALV